MNWFLAALKKYADFTGRARRKEYWFFVLFAYIIMIALVFVDTAMGTVNEVYPVGPLSGIFWLLIIIPQVAVAIRRLHDSDRTGFWLLISFVPIIGPIWFLVLMFLDGTMGPNQYGEDPKGR
jgi:uncharacterized membrane protein YhaH (DUF805 family)